MPRRRARAITGHVGVRRVERDDGSHFFYRITGYVDPASGDLITRRPSNGHWYRRRDGRHVASTPDAAVITAAPKLMIELEVDGKVHHRWIPNPER